MIRTLCFTLLTCMLFSCNDDDDVQIPACLNEEFTFEEDAEGWEGDFAEYPVGADEEFELTFSHEDMPEELELDKKGLRISGINRSDDLFMFLKRQIVGLAPNRSYEVIIDVEFASNAPEGSFGIGGSPGASVYFKAGATTEEPLVLEDNTMDIDKGEQSQPGEDMVVLGTIGIEGDEEIYKLISRDNLDGGELEIEVETDESGAFWAIVGTDSGFEGRTTLYYNRVKIIANLID